MYWEKEMKAAEEVFTRNDVEEGPPGRCPGLQITW